jgi:hypothetical protein
LLRSALQQPEANACRHCIAHPDETASEDSAPKAAATHEEARDLAMRSLREDAAGLAELEPSI